MSIRRITDRIPDEVESGRRVTATRHDSAPQLPGRSFRWGLITPEWLAALRRGNRAIPVSIGIVLVCVAVWALSIAAGGSVWSGSVHGAVDTNLARNASLIADGQWWRALTYGWLNLSIWALAFAMGMLVLAGLQVERTYGSSAFLAILAAAWTTGALTALLVEPAHAFNAGTSAAMLGVATAAVIDLLRRGVRWYRTFWAPVIGITIVLGLLFPSGVTWGAHVGGIIAGGVVGFVVCDGRTGTDRRRVVAWFLASAIVAATLIAVPFAAQYTAAHGPLFIGTLLPDGGR